jgi:hypothetical protein
MSGRVRLRMRWDETKRCLVEVPIESRQAPPGPAVFGDLPAYESPVTGKIVDGRRARREDLKRTHSRPWEGLDQERKEAAKVQAERARQVDQLADKMAHRAWAEAPERVRKHFRGN